MSRPLHRETDGARQMFPIRERGERGWGSRSQTQQTYLDRLRVRIGNPQGLPARPLTCCAVLRIRPKRRPRKLPRAQHQKGTRSLFCLAILITATASF